MNSTLNYFVGQAPLSPVPIELRDNEGNRLNCRFYDTVEARLYGSDNEIVDLTNGELAVISLDDGEFSLTWPRPSVFTKPGQYVLQLILSTADGARDVTSIAEIRVRDPRGGK